MLIFNQSRALIWVNNKMEFFEVRASIKILKMSYLGIGQSIILTGYSGELT